MAKYTQRRRHAGRKLFFWLVVLAGIILGISNFLISPEEITIKNKKIPESFRDFRIVQLSDIHAAKFFSDENTYLVNSVKGLEPDIIVITGDLIDDKYDYDEEYPIVDNLVRKLVKIAPVYYVNGNHEWALDNVHEFFDMLEYDGVTVLRNEYTVLTRGGDSIALAGLDDPCGYADRKTLKELHNEIVSEHGDDIYTVLLYHRQNLFEQYANLGFDLILSGHAHGGMVRIPGKGGLIGPSREWWPEYTSGLYSKSGTDMIVSRGLGNHTSVPRVLSLPHIPVAVLTPN